MLDGASPEVRLVSEHIEARIYLPDAQRGYYRGTRFDWSGVISSLKSGGHEYYGPWYTHRDPAVRDFVFAGPHLVAGSASAITGPAEEFVTPHGYETADAGATFVKIGVGVLRKPDAGGYSSYARYEMVDPGTWSVQSSERAVEFAQRLSDPSSHCSYTYCKTIRLADGQPVMTIEHTLRNTGRVPICTTQYNHNFLTLDRKPIGAGLTITVPFRIQADTRSGRRVDVQGNRVIYRKALDDDVVAFPLRGFGATSADYDIRVEDPISGAGLHIAGDRPVCDLALWSIRSVVSVEPFIDIRVEPSKESSWSYRYTYYAVQQ